MIKIDTKELNRFTMTIKASSPKIQKISKTMFKKFVIDNHRKIQKESPEDTGHFRASWELDFKESGDTFRGEVTNPLPYASVIEFGSTPGKKPWPSPGPKTVLASGKIYSSQAVGGVVSKVVTDKNIEDFMQTLGGILREIL